MADAGSVKYSTKMDTSGMESGVQKLSSLSIAAGQVMADAFEKVASALVDVGKQAISAMADFEQLEGGSKLMFGGAYDYIEERSKSAWKNVQMSQNEYLQQVNGFAVGLKTALNEDAQAAAELADKIVTAEADVVAATGNSAENVQNAFNGIMKGNYTMLDNLQLGIKPTKEGMEELIKSVNKWNTENGKATKYNIDNLADCQSALVDYIKKQGLSGYAAMEGVSTFSGAMASMKASWENFLSGQGSIDDVLESVGAFGGKLIEYIKDLAPRLIEGVSVLFFQLINELPGLIQELAPPLLEGVMILIENLLDALPDFMAMILEMLPQAIQYIVDALPDLINKIVEILPVLTQQLADAIPDLIPQIIDAIMLIIPMIIDNIPLLVECGAKLLLAMWQGMFNSFPSILRGLKEIFIHLWNYLKTLPSQWKNIGGMLIKGLWDGISNLGQWVINKIKSLGSNILKSVKGIFGIHSPSRVFRDEIGKNLMRGLALGIEDDTSKVIDSLDEMNDQIFDEMNKAVQISTGELNTNASVKANYGNNSVVVVNAQFDGSVEMNSQQVGRILTPVITQTIKNGGGI